MNRRKALGLIMPDVKKQLAEKCSHFQLDNCTRFSSSDVGECIQVDTAVSISLSNVWARVNPYRRNYI